MNLPKRTVHKSDIDRRDGFDSQFWPVVVALCVLGGVSLGSLITFLNGPWLWASLLGLPVALAIGVFCFSMIDNRHVRRSLQLGFLVSLIMHVLMMTGAFYAVIFGDSVTTTASRPRTIQRRTIRRPVDFPTQTWTDVNPVELPDPDEVQAEPETNTDQSPQRPQPTPVKEPEPVVDPNLVRRPENVRTTPRQQESLSRLSRQTDRDLPTSSSSAEVAANSSSSSAPQQTVQGQADVQRQSANSTNERRSTEVESSASLAAAVQRREANPTAQSPEAASAAAQRSRTQQPQANSVATATNQPTDSSPAVAQVEPQIQAERQTAAAVTGRTSAPETELVAATANAPQRRAAAESPQSERIAQSNTSTPNRVRQTIRPELADRVESSDASQTPVPVLTADATTAQPARADAANRPEPRRSEAPEVANSSEAAALDRASRRSAESAAIAEAATGGGAVRQRSSQAVQVETGAANPQRLASNEPAIQNQASPQNATISRRTTESVAQRQSAPDPVASGAQTAQDTRASRSSQPSLEPSVNPARPTADSSRRSIALSPQTASPTALETPSVAQTGQGETTQQAEARPLAISQANLGTAGGRQSRNMEMDVAAGERPAVEASSSARRERSTSSDRAGQSLAPSELAQAARMRAQAATPAANLVAETDAASALAGTSEPRLDTASASASVSEAAANLAQADVSALKGSGEVDLGPPKIVTENLNGRGSGGGQRELSNSVSPLESGTAERAARRGALAANTQADLPSSPLADGGGTPDLLAQSPDAQSLQVADGGGAADSVRGPTNGERADVDTGQLTATEVGSANLSRATVAENGRADLSTDRQPDTADPLGRRAARAAELASQSDAQIDASDGIDEDEDEEQARARSLEGLAAAPATTLPATDPTARSGAAETDLDRLAQSAGAAEETGLERRGRSESATAAPGGLAMGSGTRRPAAAVSTAFDASIDDAPSTGSMPDGAGAVAIDADEGGPSAQFAATEGAADSDARSRSAGGDAGPSGEIGAELAAGPRRARSAEVGGDSGGLGQLASNSRSRVSTLAATESGVDLGELADRGGTAGLAPETGTATAQGVGDTSVAQRAAAGGVRVEVDAETGPGGLDQDYTSAAGINDRRARPDTGPLQSFVDSRFERQRAGGLPTLNTAAAVASDAFRDRDRQRSPRRGAPQTEEAIERGLEFLVRFQEPEGHWRLERYGNGVGDATDETPGTQSDTAATGLAVLAFQGAGYNHLEYKYAEVLKKSIDWLVEHQAADGNLYVETNPNSTRYAQLYSHAIAALALCEAYGVTQDPELREPAQKALNYIIATQDATLGGWRYTPARGADTSVTGWMMMALKSGQLADLEVDRVAYQRIGQWLGQAADPDREGRFRYNPQAPNTQEQGHGRIVTRSMTAVGLLMKLYLGGNRRDADFQEGIDYLLEQLPSDENAFVRDTYYWYYATQVLRHMDGEAWQRWKEQLNPLLRQSQVNQGEYAGSWDPLLPVVDRWSGHGGRLYLTAMNLLSLEVDYRLLPLYIDTVE